MDMTIRPMKQEERKYAYQQSHEITMLTGSIGYLRGDFGRGEQFYSTWFEKEYERKNAAFIEEFDDVINALRGDPQFHGLLKSRDAMKKCCREQPETSFEGNYCTEYGFRIDTERFSYLLRCNPRSGDYEFYCFCYERRFFDRHLKSAEKGIRFITPDYKEKFNLPDGDKIRIIGDNGSINDRVCRYIDETHLEVGDVLCHICQLAERMDEIGSRIIPLRSSLPEQCYSTLKSTGELILIRKGEEGYFHTDFQMGTKEENAAAAEKYNQKLNVSKAQAAAMSAGSMFGWDVPAADPRAYNEDGHLIKPKGRDRGDCR